jgi:hypothetical protein
MLDEDSFRTQFMAEIDDWNWKGIRERVVERGISLVGCRADLLPSGRNFLIDEQALAGPVLHEALFMDLIWLETLGDIAGRYGLVVALERDHGTGEILMQFRPSLVLSPERGVDSSES